MARLDHPSIIEPLIQALEPKQSKYTDTGAYEALRKLGASRVVKPLIGALARAEQVEVRRRAAALLGELGDRRAVEPLIRALSDPEGTVRGDAVEPLDKLRDPRAIAPIIRILGDADEYARYKVTLFLNAHRGDPRTLEPLLHALGDQDPRARREAISHLGVLREPRTVEPLLRCLRDQDLEVRSKAATALGVIGDPRAVGALIEALGDQEIQVRVAAIQALGRLGDGRAVEPLIRALDDRSPEVCREAAQTLGGFGDARAITPLIRALGHSDSEVRRHAANALGRLGEQSLASSYFSSRDWSSGDWFSGLGHSGDPRAFEPLMRAFSETIGGDHQVDHRRVVKALGDLGDPRAIEPLLETLGRVACDITEAGRELCVAAAAALDRLGQPQWSALVTGGWVGLLRLSSSADPRILLVMTAALGHGSVYNRMYAAQGLGELGDARALGPLVAALADDCASVRREAAAALGKLGDARAIEPLVPLLEDAELEVRQAAAKALETLGWKPAGDAERVRCAFLRDDWEDIVAVGEPAVGFLGSIVKKEDIKLPARAAEALGRVGGTEALEALVGVLKSHRYESVRKAAAEALGQIGGLQAKKALGEAISAEPLEWWDEGADVIGDREVRLAAVQVLVGMGGAVVVELTPALSSDHAEVRRIAARGLESLGWRPADDQQRALRAIALGSWEELVAMGPLAVKPLIAALQTYGDSLESSASETLAKLGPAGVDGLLAALCESPSFGAVARALGRLRDPRAVEPLVATLDLRSISKCEQAAEALGNIGDPRAVQPLLAVFQKFRFDTDRQYVNAFPARAVVSALGKVVDSAALDEVFDALLNALYNEFTAEPAVCALFGVLKQWAPQVGRRWLECTRNISADGITSAKWLINREIWHCGSSNPERHLDEWTRSTFYKLQGLASAELSRREMPRA